MSLTPRRGAPGANRGCSETSQLLALGFVSLRRRQDDAQDAPAGDDGSLGQKAGDDAEVTGSVLGRFSVSLTFSVPQPSNPNSTLCLPAFVPFAIFSAST